MAGARIPLWLVVAVCFVLPSSVTFPFPVVSLWHSLFLLEKNIFLSLKKSTHVWGWFLLLCINNYIFMEYKVVWFSKTVWNDKKSSQLTYCDPKYLIFCDKNIWALFLQQYWNQLFLVTCSIRCFVQWISKMQNVLCYLYPMLCILWWSCEFPVFTPENQWKTIGHSANLRSSI